MAGLHHCVTEAAGPGDEFLQKPKQGVDEHVDADAAHNLPEAIQNHLSGDRSDSPELDILALPHPP